VENHQFDKMIVKYRREIVAMGNTVTQQQVQQADKQISVEELKRIIDE
jgi:predicted sulfurtransferase